MSTLLTIGFVLILTWTVRLWAKRKRLPPGPRGLPLIGNIFQMPSEKEWLYYTSLGHVYGAPIVLMHDCPLNAAMVRRSSGLS